jgi:hypothetical protein
VLAQQVREGLAGEFLEILHSILGEQIECVPGLLIELNTFAGHNVSCQATIPRPWQFTAEATSR